MSNICQLDGNISIISDKNDSCISEPTQPPPPPPQSPPPPMKQDKDCGAICLPTVATYNLRSMIPKIGNLTTDILEREIDCAF